MIKTRMTELLGIEHPIMLAGASWVTPPPFVAAVSNAGGLGVFAAGPCTPEELRATLQVIRTLTDKPFGINMPLYLPHAKASIEVVVQEKVPVVNYSLGKPWFVKQVHEYGGKVIGTVALSKHAVRSEQVGVDMLIVTGHEAAAHGADATSMVLVPVVTSKVKIPVIAAGGFYDGRGLAAALVLGAEGVSLGTRFMMTKESPVHQNFKEFCLKASEEDTLYSDIFDGRPSRMLKTPKAQAILKGAGMPVVTWIKDALAVKRMLGLSTLAFARTAITGMRGEEGSGLIRQARRASQIMRVKKAIFQGDLEEGMIPAGQNIGGIGDLPGCAEVIERIVAEAEQVLTSTASKKLAVTHDAQQGAALVAP